MQKRELQAIIDSQPSVSANTFLVGALYVVAWILFVAFLILGAGLFFWKVYCITKSFWDGFPSS